MSLYKFNYDEYTHRSWATITGYSLIFHYSPTHLVTSKAPLLTLLLTILLSNRLHLRAAIKIPLDKINSSHKSGVYCPPQEWTLLGSPEPLWAPPIFFFFLNKRLVLKASSVINAADDFEICYRH